MQHMQQFYKTTYESADQAIKFALKKFEEHPASHNQTYWEHLKVNLEKGTSTCISGGSMITHAIFPFLFQNTDEPHNSSHTSTPTHTSTTPSTTNTDIDINASTKATFIKTTTNITDSNDDIEAYLSEDEGDFTTESDEESPKTT